ncbi:olfactory receptor 5T7-like [Discoglossus pictus]
MQLKAAKKNEKLEALESKQEEKVEENWVKAENVEITSFFHKSKTQKAAKMGASLCVECKPKVAEQLEKFQQGQMSERSFLVERKSRRHCRIGSTVVSRMPAGNNDRVGNNEVQTRAIIDSGAISSFMDTKIIQDFHIPYICKPVPVPIQMINGDLETLAASVNGVNKNLKDLLGLPLGEMNKSFVQEFILSGLTDNHSLEIILFLVFLFVYIFTIVGNTGIMIISKVEPSLLTPMYFFLHHLSFSDLCYSSVILPKMLANFLVQHKVITLTGCAIQMLIFVTFGAMECFLLGIMAYDRYHAICNPLLYPIVMDNKTCVHLIVAAYTGSILNALVHTTGTFTLDFCRSNHINHFYCDIPPMLNLSCSDTTINEILLIVFGIMTSWFSLIVIIISYVYIISAIFKIRSKEGRRKVVSTCTSHFMAVSMFYGALFFMYFRPATTYSVGKDSVASIFYTIMIPMLNPLIYSLRNREVKEALKKTGWKTTCFIKDTINNIFSKKQ